MFKVLKKINRKIVLSCVSRFYRDGHLDLVLKYVPGPHPPLYVTSVYKNVFRILTLKRLGEEKWYDEYGHFLRQNNLSVIPQEDYKYMRLFLIKNLADSVDFDSHFSIEKKYVSRKVKKYFPMDMKGEELAKYFT